MRNWLIANPKAGGGQRGARFWTDHLKTAGVTDLTQCDLDNTDWMNQVSEGDLVLVAGGDGSVSCAAALCVDSGATMGVLPSGTANDFARNLVLPDDPAELCELISTGDTQLVDVARVNGKLFLNVVHVGVGTWPVRETSARGKSWGRFSYAIALMRHISAYRGFHARIHSAEGVLEGRWLSIAVAASAFYGGGNEIPEASADDGVLDIVAVRPRSLFLVLATFLAVKVSGHTPRKSGVVRQLKSHWCDLETRHHKTFTADGEVVGKTPVKVSCDRRCLRVIGTRVIHT